MDWQSAFQARDDLTPFGSEGLGIFALGVRFGLDDLQTVATEAITDGPDDKKIDILYVDRSQKSAFIMQCYTSQVKLDQQAPGNKATDLHVAATYAFNVGLGNLPEQIRAQVADLRSAISDGSVDTVYFWYVHNRTEAQSISEEMKQVEVSAASHVKAAFPEVKCVVFAQEVGRDTLSVWFNRGNNQIIVDAEIKFDARPGYEVSGTDWKCLVTSVSGREIYDLFDQHGKDLFSMNIRDYLGIVNKDSNVNHNIRNTARTEPEQFWPFNNGLTLITHDYSRGEKLTVKGLAIVNGAQTTGGAIGNLDAVPDHKLLVAARFYKVSDQDFVEKIIRYTNSQNAIEAADFRSTDAVQVRLRREFSAIAGADYNGGRRGGDRDQISRRPDLLPDYTVGQALSAFHGDPVIAYNEKGRIWNDNEAYSRIFKDETTAEHIIFVFSLLRAVELHKQRLWLKSKNSEGLTVQDAKEMNLLRGPGAQFFLVSVVASLLEVILGEPVPNRFRVRWTHKTLSDAIESWMPILEIVLSFGEKLASHLGDSLKSVEKVRSAEADMRQMLSAIRVYHAEQYKSVAQQISLK